MVILTWLTAVVTVLLLIYLFAALVRPEWFEPLRRKVLPMFQFQVWFLPFLILVVTTALAIPLSRYLAWIMDGRYARRGCCAGSSAAWTPDRRTGNSTPSPCCCSTR